MDYIEKSAAVIAAASKGEPVIATILVALFYLAFSQLEAGIESLIWGDRFEHWLDPIFITTFIAYAAYCVYACAVFNTKT